MTDITPLQEATLELNAVIDAFWNDEMERPTRIMIDEKHKKAICDAQQKCKTALETEGIVLWSNP